MKIFSISFLFIILIILYPLYNNASSIYGDFESDRKLDETTQQIIVASLTILLFVLMAFELSTPEVLFLIALVIVMYTEILTMSQAFSGFANNAVVTIGSLYFVVGAVERSHVVDWFARKAFGTGGSEVISKARMYFTCFILSTFLNNTPLVAMLLPVVKDWGRMRGIAASQLLIPLSYAVLSGSFGSMIGTSSNLTVQGLMEIDRNYKFSFFAPMPIGIILFAALAIYMLIAAKYLLPHNKNGLLREVRDKASSLIAEVYISPSSPAIGKNVMYLMTSLGVSSNSAIKIRRKKISENQNSEASQLEGAFQNQSSPNKVISDAKYFNNRFTFWSKNNSILPKSNEDDESSKENEFNFNKSILSNDYYDIIAPTEQESIKAHDIVFMSSAQEVIEKMMKSIMGESKGLYILQSDVMDLPGFGSEVIECVISDSNPFLGKKLSEISGDFATYYSAAIITLRPKIWNDNENEKKKNDDFNIANSYDNDSKKNKDINVSKLEDDIESNKKENNVQDSKNVKAKQINSIADHILVYGDILLCVTHQKEVKKLQNSSDFFVVSTAGALPQPLTFFSFIPVIVFLVMLAVVAAELIDMGAASMGAAAFFFLGGWVQPKDIPKILDIRLLMLLGCSLSFAQSMTTTGLASTIANVITQLNPTPLVSLLLIYLITLLITEVISNNAAGALMYPIAVKLADKMEVSYKPYAMAILFACSAGFMSPIGYQTHMMVWAPGGYNFKDFLIFGFVPNIIYWIGASLLVPLFFPF